MPYSVRDFLEMTLAAGRPSRFLLCFILSSLLSFGASAIVSTATDNNKNSTPISHDWASMADMVFHHFSTQQGLPQFSATAVEQDGEGFIWVGTQGGLARWDGYRFRNYLPIPNNFSSLPDNYVMSLYKDNRNRLWVGTNGGGLSRYDHRTDSFVRVPVGATGISHVTVNFITGDGKDGLWVATRGGLNHYQPDTGLVRQFRHDPNNPNSLPSDIVRGVVVDQRGVVWIATSQGLVKFDAKNNRFIKVRLPLEEGKVQ